MNKAFYKVAYFLCALISYDSLAIAQVVLKYDTHQVTIPANLACGSVHLKNYLTEDNDEQQEQLIIDIKNLIPDYPIEPSSLAPLLELWQMTTNTTANNIEKKLTEMSFAEWQSIFLLINFLQIEPLYKPRAYPKNPAILKSLKEQAI